MSVTVRPTFQAQNPAISGYRYGWESCTAFSAAMIGSYDAQVPKLCTGGEVRNQTGDFTGGLNLSQVEEALRHWNVELDVRYRLPFDDFLAKVNAGRAAVLSGYYAPIAASRFDAGNGFRGNHAIAVLPDLVVMDPLADGRYSNVYRYHGESYPAQLLRGFAGRLDLGGGHELGDGLVYAAFSHDRLAPGVAEWYATVRPAGTSFMRYYVKQGANGAQISGRQRRTTKSGFSLRCTAPRLVWENPAGGGQPTVKRSIVEVAGPSPGYDNFWIDSKWAEEKNP